MFVTIMILICYFLPCEGESFREEGLPPIRPLKDLLLLLGASEDMEHAFSNYQVRSYLADRLRVIRLAQVWRVLTSALPVWFLVAILEYVAVPGRAGVSPPLLPFQQVPAAALIASLTRGVCVQLLSVMSVAFLALAAVILRKSHKFLCLEADRAFPLRRMLFPTLGQSALSAAKAFDCYLIASGQHSATNEQLLAFARKRWQFPTRDHWLREVGPSVNWTAFSSHLQYYLFQPGTVLHPRVVSFVRVLIESVSGVDFLKLDMRLSFADDTMENRVRLANEYSGLPRISEWQFALHADRAVVEYLPVPGLCTIVADFLYPWTEPPLSRHAPGDATRVLAGRVARSKQLLSLSRLLKDPAILLYPRDASDFDDAGQVKTRADRQRGDLETVRAVRPPKLRDEMTAVILQFYAVDVFEARLD
jgi:hypothetical protein